MLTMHKCVFQDLLLLACGHPENRSCLTFMAEWPEWILEVLISNYEVLGIALSKNNFKIVILVIL
jgi:hypothetical protein